MSDNTSIVVCGEKFNIGVRVVLWSEPGGLNAYNTAVVKTQDRKTGKITVVKGKRYRSRLALGGTPKLGKLQGIVKQFALHHSGLYRSRDTYDTLQGRGLSVHFILDDDGTLYQTLDVCERAFHIGGNNSISVGIEIDSRAAAGRFPDAYDEAHQRAHRVGPRRVKIDTIHGQRMKGFEYADAQYATLVKLTRSLLEIFPLIKPDFPRNATGDIVKTTLANPKGHQGIICHYHVTDTKIDPISFDYDRFLAAIGSPVEESEPPAIFNQLSDWRGRQAALEALGYDPGPIDGIFGPRTEDALMRFQNGFGLVSTGRWDAETEAAMKQALED